MEIPSGALRLAAVALAACLLAHVVVFGMRTVMAERRESSDGMNYISVARNLSAGEGFVQSAPGQNQFTFWSEDFSPDFPAKTRHTHSIGLPLIIYAVSELTGLEHAAAAHALNAVAYGLALALAAAVAFHLWGIGGAMLAVAAISWLNNELFYSPLTEPSAVVLMLACLLALASPGGAWRFLAAGLLVAACVLVRRAMAPVFVVGILFCLLQGEKKWRSLALFTAGSAMVFAGEFVGEGVKYANQGDLLKTGFPLDVRMREVFRNLFSALALGVAALTGLAAFLWLNWKNGATGRKGGKLAALFHWLKKSPGHILLPAQSAGFAVFTAGASLVLSIEPLHDFRILYPAKITMAALGGGMAWAAMSRWRWRPVLAAAVFLLSMGAGIARDWKAYAERGDVSDAARIAKHEIFRWGEDHLQEDDFVVAHFAVLFTHYLKRVDSAVSFTQFPYELPVTAERLGAVVRHRCGSARRHLLIVTKNWNSSGPLMADLSVKKPTPNMRLLAETENHLVYRMTHCDAG